MSPTFVRKKRRNRRKISRCLRSSRLVLPRSPFRDSKSLTSVGTDIARPTSCFCLSLSPAVDVSFVLCRVNSLVCMRSRYLHGADKRTYVNVIERCADGDYDSAGRTCDATRCIFYVGAGEARKDEYNCADDRFPDFARNARLRVSSTFVTAHWHFDHQPCTTTGLSRTMFRASCRT